MKIIVSKCLLGNNCRYAGDNCKNEAVLALGERHELIPVCPEQLGGLSTPRPPAERQGEKVIAKTGRDVTAEYQTGARAALRIAQESGATLAIFKSKSPSCGKGRIYDGTFSGGMVQGNGVTCELFEQNGIPVRTELELEGL